MAYAIIGTAGHIDHGKTSLVQALTGTNTDQLAEEQRRGMTLDLGFTWFDLDEHRLAVIDVPGHEKYIANMLSGVAGIDVGLLVVAADEGVALQTREHLAIFASLQVPRLVVAMTKTDLSDEITMEIIEEDVRELTSSAGYDEVAILRVSSRTGDGLVELKGALRGIVEAIEPAEVTGPFRMPVDRCFSVPGRGCVVAGTIWEGQVAVGDQVQILPGNQIARVREVEVHGDAVDTASTGRRTALNLAGVSHTDIARGYELVAADTLQASERCVAVVRLYDDAPEIANNRVVRLHTAAGSCEVKILTGGASLLPGDEAVVVLKCERPVLLTVDQPLLLRRSGASGTFAGGRVLASARLEGQRTNTLIAFGMRLAESEGAGRLAVWLDMCRYVDLADPTLLTDVGLSSSAVEEAKRAGLKSDAMVAVPDSSLLMSRLGQERLDEVIVQRLEGRSRDGKAEWTDVASLVEELRRQAPKELIRWRVEEQIRSGQLIRLNRQITSASAMNLSTSQQELFTSLLNRFVGERQPVNSSALPELEGKAKKDIDSLLKLAVSGGMLVNLGGGWFLTGEVLELLKQELRELLAEQPELKVAAIRDHWGLTRKHAVPFLEYFDKSGLTQRAGDVRVAGAKLG